MSLLGKRKSFDNTDGDLSNLPTVSMSVGSKLLIDDSASVSAPPLAIVNDSDTGVNHPAANSVGLVCGGALVAKADTTGIVMSVGKQYFADNTASTTNVPYAFTGLANTGVGLISGAVGFINNGGGSAQVRCGASFRQYLDPSTKTQCSFSCTGTDSYGMYAGQSLGIVGLSAGGTSAFESSSSSTQMNNASTRVVIVATSGVQAGNNLFYFQEQTGSILLTATVAAGSYTPSGFATALVAAMIASSAATGNTLTYTFSISTTQGLSGRLTLTSTGNYRIFLTGRGYCNIIAGYTNAPTGYALSNTASQGIGAQYFDTQSFGTTITSSGVPLIRSSIGDAGQTGAVIKYDIETISWAATTPLTVTRNSSFVVLQLTVAQAFNGAYVINHTGISAVSIIRGFPALESTALPAQGITFVVQAQVIGQVTIGIYSGAYVVQIGDRFVIEIIN